MTVSVGCCHQRPIELCNDVAHAGTVSGGVTFIVDHVVEVNAVTIRDSIRVTVARRTVPPHRFINAVDIRVGVIVLVGITVNDCIFIAGVTVRAVTDKLRVPI